MRLLGLCFRIGAFGALAFAALAATSGSAQGGETLGKKRSSLVTDGTWIQQIKFAPSDGTDNTWFGGVVALSGTTALLSAHWHDENGVAQVGSAYVFVRDGNTWTEEQRLAPSAKVPFQFFSQALTLRGDTALIGAPGYNDFRGAAYVFVRSGTSFSEQQQLLADDGAANDDFGGDVGLDGDNAVVGASGNADLGDQSGSAYVFVRSGTKWNQVAKLTANDGATYDRFGGAVAISGDTVAIGAPGDGSPDPSGLPQPPTKAGSVYVFVKSGTSFALQQKLIPSDGSIADRFGGLVNLDGDTLFVGAPADAADQIGTGAVYMFSRSGGKWAEQQIIHASDAHVGAAFGGALGVSGQRLLIGSANDNAKGENSGSVYAYVFDGASYVELQKFTTLDAKPTQGIGQSLSLDGTSAIVGGSDLFDGAGYAIALLGADCSNASDCGSGYCADTRCCDTACADACQACNLPGSEGTCTPVAAGQPDQCVPYVCTANAACGSTCASTSDCAPGYVCNANAQCVRAPHDSAASDSSGCGCRVGRGAVGAALWWLAPLLGCVAIRRRRARHLVRVYGSLASRSLRIE